MQTQAAVKEPPRIGRASLWLFVSLSCAYLLFARGRITSGDEWHIYGTTESLAERGSWRVEVDGFTRAYSRYSVIPSLLGVPFYELANPLVRGRGERANDVPPGTSIPDQNNLTRRDILQAAVSLQTPFITAATATLLFLTLGWLGVAPAPSLATAGVYALGTMALPYCSSMYTQPLAALGIAALVASAATGSFRMAGASLLLLLAVRLEYALLFPVLLMYGLRWYGASRMRLSWLVGGLLSGVALSVLVNILRGDSALAGDYGSEGFTTPLWIGLHGILLSPGKGLAWFSPVAAIGLCMLPWLWRRMPRIGFLAGSIVGISLILVACWWTWHGARSWGPRLLLPVMPLLVLPLAWLFQDWKQQTALRRILILAAVLASVAIQVWGSLRDPVSEAQLIPPPLAVNENESIYIPQVGPWGVESQSFPDLLLFRVWEREPHWRSALVALASGVLILFALTLWRGLRLLNISRANLKAVIPPLRTHELVVVATSLLLFFLPEIVGAITVVAGRSWPTAQYRGIPQQYSRLHMVSPGQRLSGHLYVPITGEYMFYLPAIGRTRVELSGHGTLASSRLVPSVVALKAGFNRIEIHGDTPGQLDSLYWTTPGLSMYKEPVSQSFFAGPQISWWDRLAIVILQGKWVIWLVILTLWLNLLLLAPARE